MCFHFKSTPGVYDKRFQLSALIFTEALLHFHIYMKHPHPSTYPLVICNETYTTPQMHCHRKSEDVPC